MIYLKDGKDNSYQCHTKCMKEPSPVGEGRSGVQKLWQEALVVTVCKVEYTTSEGSPRHTLWEEEHLWQSS